MSVNRSMLALVTSDKAGRGIDHELMLFIDRAVVPILVQRWLEQSGESGSKHAAADPLELPAAA